MGIKNILPETKVYTTELYGHKWEIEAKILSYKAKQEYLAAMLKNKKVKKEEIELANITANDLLETFKVIFFNGVNYLKVDGEEEKIDKDTYDYLINNLSLACEWIQNCIFEFNGNFFLVKS